jgi:FkbM family methyltransferase
VYLHPQKSPTLDCGEALTPGFYASKQDQMTRDNWVRSLGLDADGSLFVEIDNGIRLYDSCLQNPLPGAVTIPPADLMKPENRQLYYRFLTTLKEIESVVINSIYDGSSPFRRGAVVVDAGARIGAFTAKVSAALGEEGRIIAIEPEPRNFACLRKNIETNNLKNVAAIQKALWSQKQRLSIFISGNAAAHSVYHDAFYSSTSNSISVEADTLDDILQELDITSVDFIKMDIEGSEIEALKGMRKVLESQVQLSVAAYHPVEGRLAHTVIVPQLTQLGFKTTFADGIVHARR